MARGWSAAVHHWAERDACRPAVVTAGYSWSWAELLGRAGGAARFLSDLGAAVDAPVPALVDDIGLSMAFTLGGASARRPYAPLGTRLTATELAAIVGRMDAPVLVAEPPHGELAEQVAQICGCRIATITSLPNASAPPPPGPDAVVAVLHTSGTTGLPKPVTVVERALAGRLRTLDGLAALGPGDTYLVASAFHHVAGFGNNALGIGLGAAVASFPRFSVDGWNGLQDKGITHALVVPSMVVDLLRTGALAAHRRLRVLLYGGAPMRPDLLQQTMDALPGVDLLQLFGQTEGSPITALTPDDHRRARAGRPELLRSVGRPAPGVELRVHAPDADGIGEVWARAEHMNATDREGWCRSGDLGHLDANGYLYLDGRHGDTINRGGENVRPVEVEDVLRRHPAVAEVAVAGVPDDRLGQRVAAFVVPVDPAATPDWDGLRAFARAELAGFKVPELWRAVPDLPRNAGGKVLRRVLVAQEVS